MIDLHTHSTFSDGSLTPTLLVEKAAAEGITAMALTDHDSTGGVAEFLAACRRTGINGIPGVEISAEIARGTMHILGYFIDVEDAPLQKVLADIRAARTVRNREMLRRLNAAGLALEMGEVEAFAGEEVVGRVHFAKALLARGYVRNKDEAFALYLGKGKPGYADRYRLMPDAACALIRSAGGVPVLAHPFTLDLDTNGLRTVLRELAAAGLGGMEVYYSEHSPDQVSTYAALARELGLVASGGTDFHGDINPEIKLGRGFGRLGIPDGIVAELLARSGRKG